MTRCGATMIAGATAGVLLFASGVGGYYDDTHYSFTYYMARECGYTPLQAHRLASADVSVDSAANTFTEPVQGIHQAQSMVGGAVIGAAVGGALGGAVGGVAARIPDAAQRPRADFHAMRDARVFGRGQQGEADAAIDARRDRLLAAAFTLGNPGIALHFIQDMPAHHGYSTTGGHWLSAGAMADASLTPRDGPRPVAALDLLADSTLPMGGTTDFLSYRPDKTNQMIAMTVAALRAFMQESSPGIQRPGPCSDASIRAMRDRLMRVNKVTRIGDQYLTQVGLGDALPSVVPANGEVIKALGAGERPPFFHAPIDYRYNADGEPVEPPLDAFTLYGALEVRLSRAAFASDPVEVSVWATPTRAAEAPYLLGCLTATGRTESGPIFAEKPFERLPVGGLIVQAVTHKGTVAKQEVVLDALRKEVVIEVPEESDATARCGDQAKAVAQLLCARRSTLSSKDLRDYEQRFLNSVSSAESCRAAQLTQAVPVAPTGPTPKGGGAAGKALGIVAAVAGGVSAALALEQYLATLEEDEASTSSTPTSTSTTPSSPAPSAARCSTRNCIVNVLGAAGSCQCSGSLSVTCPSSSIQTQVGGACFNNGMYCAENLSCNNNRCERDYSQGGRCRF